jgi:hypothetical protein
MIYFGLLYMSLSTYHDLGHEFGGLTLVDYSYFLCPFFNQFF